MRVKKGDFFELWARNFIKKMTVNIYSLLDQLCRSERGAQTSEENLMRDVDTDD